MNLKFDAFDPYLHGSRRCWWLGHDYNKHNRCKHCVRPTWIEESDERIPRLLDRLRRRYSLLNYVWEYQVRPQLRPIIRCKDCRKPKKVFRWRVGNHKKCKSLQL